MRRYPGYTLGQLATDDVRALALHLALLDPDVGTKEP